MIKWTIIFLLACTSVRAQQVSFTGSSRAPITVNEGFELKIPPHSNQYLTSKWASGSLHYLNNTSKNFDSLNFERHTNNLEVVSKNKILALMPMGLTGVIINNSGSSGYVILVAKADSESRFIIINSLGKNLLGSYLLVDEPPVNHTYAEDELRFIPKEKPSMVVKEKFVVLKDGTWQPFKLNKSSITKLFGVDKKEIQKITSELNISTSDREGLVTLFQTLNAR